MQVSDDSHPTVRLGVGNFADPIACESLLDQLTQEIGSPDVSDTPLRMIQSHGLAVVLESQVEITPQKSHLLQLFLQHAAETIGNAGQHSQKMIDDQLAALGQTLGFFAHDLRGPLGTIRQVIDVLRRDEVIGMTQEELHEILDNSVRAATRIIDDCVEFGQGTPKVCIVQGTWNQLLQSPIDLLKQDIDRLGVELELDVDESCTLHLDPRLMSQVIGNLCKHACEAVKRQPSARVTVGVRSDNSETQLWVADNGPGLPPDSQQSLFQPFASKSSELTGLALPISKRLVDAHGGTITVETGDSGTRFNISLPRPSRSDATE